ncbi:hypothetical protein AMATHDRAFT_43675 [Amanita thiersii Skay4041]|uniref:Uncharacterized protein n=1 Tax=Amanita thiersii Skay4041 TaxID=703135 RepID=A0A2A9N7W3_9AGAR|nr:hypothetical protein AMATHDRAFT_43675 [Amanita thiersii Skay4041]
MSTLLSALFDALKPHRAEALQRIRVNILCLTILIVLTYLLPLPSLPTAFKNAIARTSVVEGNGAGGGVPVYTTYGGRQRWGAVKGASEGGAMYSWVCMIESAAAGIFMLNIMQGLYALRYPRKALALPSSPSKAKAKLKARTSPVTPKHRPFKMTSPKSASEPQRPFSFSPSSSVSSSHPLNASTTSISLPQSLLSSSTNYPTTPLSNTPSRGSLQYSLPFSLDASSRSLRSSTGPGGVSPPSSSTSTAFPTSPSPVISAWRGKHLASEIGRPLDGSFLGQLSARVEDNEE